MSDAEGRFIMTREQKLMIVSLRSQGLGYKRVADRLGIFINTVKSFCRRQKDKTHEEDQPGPFTCKCCGVTVKQTPGRKKKLFCSDKCRMKWWNEHPELVERRAFYEKTCPNCGRVFTVYGDSKRKYCCHECYVEHRFG